ncbi:MogA/MoaB family molybdenum cofactor biosynthesis protein [Coprothermobacter platensis]|uniref:MogA/MoaB family molybdenum cofactor biosynthesis protein n=1 Tax=Coprothermobacter platensis TaxID=108819 RepID=UPI0003609ABA|nr:MogA/MoaB family molybdenum cofactor biosynthesis protein [Coprothermobacter platensis]
MNNASDKNMQSSLSCCILICSDRSFRGEREDKTGPLLVAKAEELGYAVKELRILPDERQLIAEQIRRWCELPVDLILTSGGTGVGPRDVTPEATMDVVDREIPGIPLMALMFSLKSTPNAALSRAKAGVIQQTIVVNLPGSPNGASDIFQLIDPALKHAIPIVHGQIIE